ncbi:DUF998 domain-containing protein [Pseudomonas protegens]|uniref:DUF998 domain-containing protein n=3 Tax=Pseudomonas protegens TaxID=380021 RepID=UPI001E34D0F5|nr:DUF998 domain-containing protein [Pseudomonas protegens]
MNIKLCEGQVMLSTPQRPEIDNNTIKLQVGIIAMVLANVTDFLSGGDITSISASYHESEWGRNLFVGLLFAISAFMLAYNGFSRKEMLLSKVAAVAAFGVATFPCGCNGYIEIIPHVHYVSAAVMFSILAYFCYLFRGRAESKGHVEARRRSVIYTFCGVAIVLSMLVMVVDHVFNEALSGFNSRLTFYCERVGLIAFGISWLTASKLLPVISAVDERTHPFK